MGCGGCNRPKVTGPRTGNSELDYLKRFGFLKPHQLKRKKELEEEEERKKKEGK